MDRLEFENLQKLTRKRLSKAQTQLPSGQQLLKFKLTSTKRGKITDEMAGII
jgi:hypothetical protein